ncbi:MAG TPA: hypothetical protein DCE44_13070 [Verrucomicrobiales bacterium]|nr:hypothetical protein [Verrucomicrobiales bacterium]
MCLGGHAEDWDSSCRQVGRGRFDNLRMAKITILPAQATAEVPDGENLIEAGEAAGVEMEAGCFNCSCGTCVAEVVSGMENITEPTPEELDVLDQWNKDPEKFRLTCCNKILHGEVVLRAGH